MAHQDRETTVVTTGSGGAGWFVAFVLLAIVAFGGFLLYDAGEIGSGSDINVSIDVPAPAD